MRPTKKFELDQSTICIPRERLPQLLGCGQATADRLSMEAKARIRVGKRVLVKLDILTRYLETVAE